MEACWQRWNKVWTKGADDEWIVVLFCSCHRKCAISAFFYLSVVGDQTGCSWTQQTGRTLRAYLNTRPKIGFNFSKALDSEISVNLHPSRCCFTVSQLNSVTVKVMTRPGQNMEVTVVNLLSFSFWKCRLKNTPRPAITPVVHLLWTVWLEYTILIKHHMCMIVLQSL